ncbi:MAG TPA: glycosyltransferase, partial [Telluria sp.]
LAYFLYRAVRYVESPSVRNATLIGLSLGALILTRGWLPSGALLLALFACARFLRLPTVETLRHIALAAATAFAITLVWILPATLLQPYGMNPVDGWLSWNASQIGMPSWQSLKNFLRVGLWYFWPAWPFAIWSAYAWRRQHNMLHIVLPLTFVGALALLILCDPTQENGDLIKLLPPLAIMAAFGLPTMKRGTINAIDWFSVMVLTMLGAVVWLFWIAKLTGWPAQLSKNVLRLVPGFKPEFGVVAFTVAAAATVGWIMLVHWRLSRQPSVLWRAVVLSSGGLILLWVLVMTLFLPELNYSKSYASVAQQIAARMPPEPACIDTNVGAAQRATLAYYGRLPFAGVVSEKCEYVLLQDSVKVKDDKEAAHGYKARDLTLLWEGRRPSDRDERFRLYRRTR